MAGRKAARILAIVLIVIVLSVLFSLILLNSVNFENFFKTTRREVFLVSGDNSVIINLSGLAKRKINITLEEYRNGEHYGTIDLLSNSGNEIKDCLIKLVDNTEERQVILNCESDDNADISRSSFEIKDNWEYNAKGFWSVSSSASTGYQKNLTSLLKKGKKCTIMAVSYNNNLRSPDLLDFQDDDEVINRYEVVILLKMQVE